MSLLIESMQTLLCWTENPGWSRDWCNSEWKMGSGGQERKREAIWGYHSRATNRKRTERDAAPRDTKREEEVNFEVNSSAIVVIVHYSSCYGQMERGRRRKEEEKR